MIKTKTNLTGSTRIIFVIIYTLLFVSLSIANTTEENSITTNSSTFVFDCQKQTNETFDSNSINKSNNTINNATNNTMNATSHECNNYAEQTQIEQKISELNVQEPEYETDFLNKFNLDFPEKIQTQMISKKIVFEEEKRVLIIMREPKQIWTETQSFNKNELKKLKKSIKNHLIETNNLNVIEEPELINGFFTKIKKENYHALINSPFVSSIDEEFEVEALLHDSLNIMNVIDTWNYKINNNALNGEGQSICVIDTGINYEHLDLGGEWGNKIIAGYRFINDEEVDCTINNTACFDDSSTKHGTHVSGIISADGTIKGVAPKSKLVIIKALSNSQSGIPTGSSFNIIKGIEWCTTNKDKYNISIISMSIGIGEYYDYCDEKENMLGMSLAINNAVDSGIAVVAATGNSGQSDRIVAPACIKNAIRVGSTNKDNAVSSFTNTWNKDIVLATGSFINSTTNTNSYGIQSGTSMATPHVSGAIAIINQHNNLKNKTMNSTELFDLINNTGTKTTRNEKELSILNLFNIFNYLTSLNFIIESPQNIAYNTTELLINITINMTDDENNNETITSNLTFKFQNETFNYSKPINFTFKENENILIIKLTKENTTLEKNISFFIDMSKPNVSVISPVNGTFNLYQQLININVTDNYEIHRIWFNWNGSNITYNGPINVLFPEGNHTLYVWAEDTAGNINQENTTFSIKITQPIINNASMNQSIVTSQQDLFLIINTTHDNEIKLFLNQKELVTNSTHQNFEVTTNVSFLGCENIEEYCNINITIVDKNENEHTINTTILVDDIAPKINIIGPLNNSVIKNITPNIIFNATDGIDEIVLCNISLNNKSQEIYVNNTNILLNSEYFSLEFNKNYDLTIKCEDTMKNFNSETVKFSIMKDEEVEQQSQPANKPSSFGGGGGGGAVRTTSLTVEPIPENISIIIQEEIQEKEEEKPIEDNPTILEPSPLNKIALANLSVGEEEKQKIIQKNNEESFIKKIVNKTNITLILITVALLTIFSVIEKNNNKRKKKKKS